MLCNLLTVVAEYVVAVVDVGKIVVLLITVVLSSSHHTPRALHSSLRSSPTVGALHSNTLAHPDSPSVGPQLYDDRHTVNTQVAAL